MKDMNSSDTRGSPKGFPILRKPPIVEATFQMNFVLKSPLTDSTARAFSSGGRDGDVESINSLQVEPQPSSISNYHANIIGWDNDVARQLLEAEWIAAAATFVRRAS